jgi:hypothetical protein
MTPHEVKIAALCNGNLILSATNKTLVFVLYEKNGLEPGWWLAIFARIDVVSASLSLVLVVRATLGQR